MARKKAIAKRKSSAMSKPAKPTGELMEQLNRQKATIKVGSSNSISVDGNEFFVGEDSIGEEVYAVILENVFEHRYFEEEYEEGVVKAPDCFSLALDEGEMVPHPNSPSKQAESCGQCEWNRFGSGRGKAKRCQNRIRLMLLPADDADTKTIDETETFVLHVSPINIGTFNKYADMCLNKLEVPTSLVITKITAEQERGKTYSELSFEYDSPLPAPANFQKQLVSKVMSARNAMLSPYEISVDEDQPAGRSKRKTATKKKSSSRKSRMS